jgi:DNA-binding response OmpR family regulator
MILNSQPYQPPPIVSLFNASDDTVEMVKRMLETTGICCLTSCRFADLRKGNIDFNAYLRTCNPAVVIFDISPPYIENWEFFKTMRDSIGMEKRGLVLTTTNKLRLDEIIGNNSKAIEIVGKPYDLQQIYDAIERALRKTEASLN